MVSCYKLEIKKVHICTETDALLPAIMAVGLLKMNDYEIWLDIGHGAHIRYIVVPAIAIEMGVHYLLYRFVMYMHVLTGCNAVFVFCSVARKQHGKYRCHSYI